MNHSLPLAALALSIVSVPSSAQNTPSTTQTPQAQTAQPDYSRFALENGCVTTVTRKRDGQSWANTVCGGANGQPAFAAAADGENGRSRAYSVGNTANAIAWHQCTRAGLVELRSSSQGEPLAAIAATIAAREAAAATRNQVRITCRNIQNNSTEIPLTAPQVIRPSTTRPAEQPAETDPRTIVSWTNPRLRAS